MTAIQERANQSESAQDARADREAAVIGSEAEGEINQGEINLGPIAQIPLGEGRQFRVAGRDIAVFRARNGGIYATQAACPHRHGPLVDGLMGGSVLVCPLHAWKWELTTGKPLMGDCDLATYAVRLTDTEEILLRA